MKLIGDDPLSNFKQEDCRDLDTYGRIDTYGREKDSVLPIFNLEVETWILGNIMLDPKNLDDIAGTIREKHFYSPLHQKIFIRMTEMRNKGTLPTLPLLVDYTKEDVKIKADYLEKCARTATGVFHIIDMNALCEELIALTAKRLMEAGLKRLFRKLTTRIEMPEFIEETEKLLFRISRNINNPNQGELKHISSFYEDTLETTKRNFANKTAVIGIPTGFRDFDNLIGGLQDSDLLIIAGRPSMGKTAFALSIAFDVAKRKIPVGFFSLEMSSLQLLNRMLSIESGVNSHCLRTGMMKDNDFHKALKALETVKEIPFYIDDTGSLSIDSLRPRVRKAIYTFGIRVIFVDYLQLMVGEKQSSRNNKVQEISEITQKLKTVAKEFNIPVVVLSQLSRAVEQREGNKPQLADLRDSGSIEQDADTVAFIYREEYYERRKQPPEGTPEHEKWREKMDRISNESEIIISKQRNGPIGSFKMYFESNTTKFKDYKPGEGYSLSD